MKKASFLIFLFMFLSSLSQAQEKKVYKDDYLVRTGDMAPDFVINEAGGKSYRLSELRGRVVMLQFTASWCSVCRKEMPYIEKEIWIPGKKDGQIGRAHV